MVLRLDGTGIPTFVHKGRIKKQLFTTMVDSESPITIFTKEDVRKILRSDVIFARLLPKKKENVDYKVKPSNLIGIINVDGHVGKQTIEKRPYSNCESRKEIIGGTRLVNASKLLSTGSKQRRLVYQIVNSIVNKIEMSPE